MSYLPTTALITPQVGINRRKCSKLTIVNIYIELYCPHFLSEFSNSSQWRSAGLDLAALSLCDYLVLSRGTFGLWSSILSGAVRITPKHRTAAGDPLLLNNQVPLIDFSHSWMSSQTRTELGSVCPQCLQRLPAGSKYQTKPTGA